MQSKQKNTVILILILGCFVLFMYRIIPGLMGLGLSIKDYSSNSGFWELPFIGMKNFKTFFTTWSFPRIISNTIRINVVPVLITVPIATILIFCVNQIKSRNLRLFYTLILSVPAVIPSIMIANFLDFTVGIKINDNYTLFYGFAQAFKLTGFLVIASYLLTTSITIKNSKHAAKFTGIILMLLVIVSFAKILTSNYELAHKMMNPLIYREAVVLDTYHYRAGTTHAEFGVNSAVWVFKNVIETVLTFIAAILVYATLRFAGGNIKNNDISNDTSDTIYKIICSILSVLVVFALYMIIVPAAKNEINQSLPSTNYFISIIILVPLFVISLASSFVASILAYPFTSKKTSVIIVYLLFLIPSTYGSFIIQQYLIYEYIGILKTIFPILLSTVMPVWMIAANAVYINRPGVKEITSMNDYMKSMLPAIVIFASINFSLAWGGYTAALAFTTNPKVTDNNIPFMIRHISFMGKQSLVLNLILIIPILLVWVGIYIYFSTRRKRIDLI